MQNELIDVVVPVWNHPIETRECLASLIENSTNTRLILVDNSSDRETEQMLGDFAEALDVRALFLKNRVNEGFVKAVNRGLSRAESRFVAIVRQNSIVRPGWLEPLHDFIFETPDAGIVVPGYFEKGSKSLMRKHDVTCRGMEVSSADFAALLMRRSLLETTGYFCEEMDGALFCLKEYSRRVWKTGFRTCTVPEGVVSKSEELNLGSAERRAEHEQRVRAIFKGDWGEEQAFCIYLPKGSNLGSMNERFHHIAAAARQGNRIMLVAHPVIATEFVSSGFNRFHEYISIRAFSRLIPERSAGKAVSDFSMNGLPLTHVNWEDGVCLPGESSSIMFSEFEQIISDNEQRYYEREISGGSR